MREMKDSGVDSIGFIPFEWTNTRLKYLCSITTGDSDTQDATPKGKYPFYVRSPIVERSDKFTFEGDGILIAGDGAGAGRIFHRVHGKYAVHQRVYRLYDFKNVNIDFIYHYLESLFPSEMDRGSAQSTVPSIRLPMLTNLQVALPPIEEQNLIVSFVSEKVDAITEAIARHRSIIEKLEEYKKSVITQAVTKGLNPDVEMKDSGIPWIGEMPEKWGVMRIKDTSWLKGRIGWDGLKASEFIDEGPYLITGTDFCDGYINWDTCVHITKQRFEEDTLLHIRENDLLITKDGTVGKVAIAKDCPKETSLNSGVMIIRNKSKYIYNSKYMYYILLSDEFKHWFEYSQKPGSTIKHLYQHQFGEFKHTFPPLEEQQQIADFLDSKCSKINESIEQSNKVIQKLEEYKKSLIYNAVTGKIDCRNA